MAQAGIHGMVGLAAGRWMPSRRFIVLGLLLGNLLPDLDNLAVAAATLSGGEVEGLHRTFSHSLFFALALALLGMAAAAVSRRQRWGNLGIGLAAGVTLHTLLDLLIWFNGVELFWPLPSWVNLWPNVTPPEWYRQLMMPAEFLALALYFWALGTLPRRRSTEGRQPRLQLWIGVQLALFILFAVLVYTVDSGFMTIYGAVYLLSLFLAFAVTIQLRQAIEAAPAAAPPPAAAPQR